jgi:hypothetical protein
MKFLKYMIPLDIELKAFAMFSFKTTLSKWRSRVHLMLWITAS